MVGFPDARRPGDLRLVGREAGAAFAFVGVKEGFGASERRECCPAVAREDPSRASGDRCFGQPGEAVPVVDGVCLSVPPAHVLRFPVGVTEYGWQVASGQLCLHAPGGVLDPGGHGCGRVALGHRVPSHPLRVW